MPEQTTRYRGSPSTQASPRVSANWVALTPERRENRRKSAARKHTLDPPGLSICVGRCERKNSEQLDSAVHLNSAALSESCRAQPVSSSAQQPRSASFRAVSAGEVGDQRRVTLAETRVLELEARCAQAL